MGTVTELLVRWNDGDRGALDELTTLTYEELRKLARAHLRLERPDHILQPTALVHAVYEQLVPMREMSWQCRTQFYGMVTRMMKNILVDHARRHLADKRSGKRSFITLDKADRFLRKQNVDLLELNDALELLAATYPEHCKVVELRFFGGMTIEETAEVVGLSHATVERHWNFARAWLRKERPGRDFSRSEGIEFLSALVQVMGAIKKTAMDRGFASKVSSRTWICQYHLR